MPCFFLLRCFSYCNWASGVISRWAAKIRRGSFMMEQCSENLNLGLLRFHFSIYFSSELRRSMVNGGADFFWSLEQAVVNAVWCAPLQHPRDISWDKASCILGLRAPEVWKWCLFHFVSTAWHNVGTHNPGGKRKVVLMWEQALGSLFLMQIGMFRMAVAGGSDTVHWRTN